MFDWLTPDESQALLLSLRVSLVAVFAALPFAFAAALLLSRRIRGINQGTHFGGSGIDSLCLT